jgi:hypothetical protein
MMCGSAPGRHGDAKKYIALVHPMPELFVRKLGEL